MSTGFDGYHKWLGIPPQDQPPHHYRLLGVALFEADPEVISNAADQRMGLLKTFAAGAHGLLAENLLNEVARARVCLSNPAKKLAYDEALRSAATTVRTDSTTAQQPSLPTGIANSGSSESSVATSPPPHERAQAEREIAAKVPAEPVFDPLSANAAPIAASLATISSLAKPAVDPSDASSIPDIVAIPRPQQQSQRSSNLALLWVILGGFVGLMAGYFALCIIDLRYDFLHLIATETSAPPRRAPRREIVQLPRTEPESQPAPRRLPPRPRVIRRDEPVPIPQPAPPQIQNRAVLPKQVPPRQELIGKRVNLFAALPPQLPVPVPGVVNGPVDLAPAPLNQTESLKLEILEGHKALVGQLAMTRRAQVPPWKWDVTWSGNGRADVATFSIENDSLRFEWARNPDRDAVAALRNNSILNLRGNDQDHFVALRVPKTVQPHTFDLNKTTDRIQCDSDDLPALDRLRLDITDLEQCPPHAPLEAVKLAINDETVFRYSNVDAVATKATFTAFKGEPCIELESRYRLPSGDEGTLNIRDGNQKLVKLRKLVALQSSNAALWRELSALDRVAALATGIHEKVKVHYRLYFFVDGHEIELATTDP